MKKIISIFIGSLIMLAGIVGLLLPVIPGWLLIFVGLSVIAPSASKRLRHKIFGRFIRQPILFSRLWRRQAVCCGTTTRYFPTVIKNTDDLYAEPEKQKNIERFLSKAIFKNRDNQGSCAKFVFLKQVHSDKVVVADDATFNNDQIFVRCAEADALVTYTRNIVLLVMTADCLPIFFVLRKKGERNISGIALAHAGWRGTKACIGKKTAEMLMKTSNPRNALPEEVLVAFGPCIGKNRYKVTDEFKAYFCQEAFHYHKRQLYFDLIKENKRQLAQLGVPLSQMRESGFCTAEDNTLFYSHRLEGDRAGRNISFITIS